MPDRSIADGIVASAGCDYLTAVGENFSRQKSVEQLGYRLLEHARRDGNRQYRRTTGGYDVVHVGGVSLGVCESRAVLRVSGARAASVCREIAEVADNLSRIDLQTTVRFNRDIHSLARKHEQELRRVQRDRRKPLYTSLVTSRSRGDTLYVGSRRSTYYGRVYNKRLESKDPAYDNCWRYEVEVKGDGTKALTKSIREGRLDSEKSATLVADWFSRHGCDVRYRPAMAASLTPIGAVSSDRAARLRWLQHAVAPSLKWLQQWYSKDELRAFLFDGAELPKSDAREGERLFSDRGLFDR